MGTVGVHGPRAGRRRAGLAGERLVQRGRDALSGADRPAAVRGPVARRDDEEADLRPAAAAGARTRPCPEDLNALCVDLLRRDPADRPTGEEIVRRLGGIGLGGRDRAGRRGRGCSSAASAQLAQLDEAFTAVSRGRTSAVFVHGRSGAGKSTLLQRFLEGLLERGEAVVLGGRCYEQESVAYKAIDTLIDSLTRYLRRLHRHEAEGLMPRDVTALARVFPVLRRVDAVAEAPNRSAEVHDPQELRRRAFGALRELLARIGDRKPLVLAIDDLQWGDVDSAALLCELLQPPDPPLLLLVCAYRSEYATQSPCLRMLLDPQVSGLPAEGRREVAVDALSQRGVARAGAASCSATTTSSRSSRRRMIARESRGSPYLRLRAGGAPQRRRRAGGPLEHPGLDLAGRRPLGADRAPARGRRGRSWKSWPSPASRSARPTRSARPGSGPEGFAALASLRASHLIRGTGAGRSTTSRPTTTGSARRSSTSSSPSG